MRQPTRAAWQRTAGPVYERLFRRFFDATISRLNRTLEELSVVHSQIVAVRSDLDSLRADLARLSDRIEHLAAERQGLDDQVRGVLAARWDELAVNRRLAAIEDRIAER